MRYESRWASSPAISNHESGFISVGVYWDRNFRVGHGDREGGQCGKFFEVFYVSAMFVMFG